MIQRKQPGPLLGRGRLARLVAMMIVVAVAVLVLTAKV